MINSHRPQKSKSLSLHQLKEKVAQEINWQPVELVSAAVNRKAWERLQRAERIEQLYQQAQTEVAAKMNLHREGLLTPPHRWIN